MYRITEGNLEYREYGEESYLDNWPMLYILENGKQAYIGQSNHVKTRMGEHLSKEQKRIFDKVHFIYSSKFNQSVTFDYEAKLIRYVAGDEVFEVTNKNSGMADKDYYNKKEYDSDFYKLWRSLQRKKLVKHSIEEIENSDLFKYSPFKELNDEQRIAVDTIVEAIQNHTAKTIVVNGMPGSGKTIVAIYILKLLKDLDEFKDKKIGFVVPQTSLRKTMKKVFKSIYNLKPSDVLSPSDITKERYDILLVDEAHRLHQYKNISYMGTFKSNCEKLGLSTEHDELDWVLHQSECSILFYDKDQVVGPSGIDIERFVKKFDLNDKRHLVKYFTLLSQMRVLGGNDYIDLVKNILSGKASGRQSIENYDLRLINDFKRFNELLYEKENEYSLCRMAAGYAWKWESQKDKTKYDIEIDGIRKQWNHCTEGWLHSEGAIDEVGCIHSTQGYDLNYGFIIMGEEIGYDKAKKELIIRPEKYFDQNGRRSAEYDELLEYIKNIYYVLLTRGIKGTYIYVCDDDLREYIASVIGEEE